MLSPNARLVEQAKIVQGLSPITPSSSTPDQVSLKNYHRMTVVISVNNATSVTGSAIALQQRTSVGGTPKALAFARMWANADISAGDTLTETTVVSDTFTTLATDNADAVYVIEITPDMLDIENEYDVVNVTTGDAANTVLSVVYLLWPAKFAGATPPTAVTD